MLCAEASQPILMVLPFDGNKERKVRTCTKKCAISK